MREFTTISVIRVLTAVSCEVNRWTSGNLPSGIRYAVFIQNPVSGFVTALIDVTCLTQ